MRVEFCGWLSDTFDISPTEIHRLRLDAAFEIFLSRLESARDRRAKDPLVTITAKAAGGNSRLVTRRMLDQLGYEPAERRAVHRLFAGSNGEWPGLLRLFGRQQEPTPQNVRYVRRQLCILRNVRRGEPARVAR